MLKRFFILLLCLVMTAGLVACGDNVETDPEAQTSEPDEEQLEVIKIATGVITGQFNRVYATEEGDKLISSLIMPTLYAYDRNGRLLTDASAGKTVAFEGTDYYYKTLADINVSYDEASKKSTFTIKLGDGISFSDGTAVTADDLIFTYYALCDESYKGPYALNSANIEGLTAYKFNNSEAPNITVTDNQIEEALNKPSDDLKTYFNAQLIRPTIEEGRKFCEENWEKYVDRGYGESAQELFVMLFPMAIDSDYSAQGKTFDDITEETVALFSMNYKALARIYYGDVEYLNSEAYSIVRKFIYEESLKNAGGNEVHDISGIKRIDDRTVSVTAFGSGNSLRNTICNIPVLSLDYYGDRSNYNYDTLDFGLERGDVEGLKTNSNSPLGYGPYKIYSVDDRRVVLVPNENYYKPDEIPSENLSFEHYEEDRRVEAIENGEIDLTLLDYNEEEIEAIGASASELCTIECNDNVYNYFGFRINGLSGVAPTGEGVTETNDQRLTRIGSMRNALGILLFSLRENAVNSTIGKGGKLLNYPGSSALWAVPAPGDDAYVESFAYYYDKTPIEKGKEMEAVKTELARSGYTIGEDGKVVGGEGIKTTLSVAIPAYHLNDSAMMALFDSFEAEMTKLGFKLEKTYFEQNDEFLEALAAGKYDIWMAKHSARSFNLADYYKSKGKYNFYGLNSPTVDRLITEAGSNPDIMEKNYKTVLKSVMYWGFEVPVYQKQNAVCYNPQKVHIDSLAFTEYYGLFDAPWCITRYDPAKHLDEETETAPESSEPETTLPATSSEAEQTSPGESTSAAGDTVPSASEGGTTTAVTSAAQTVSQP